MPKKTTMPDLIFVVPGIMGSVLQKDNKDLWNMSRKKELVKSLTPEFGWSFNSLMMEGDDYSLDDLGDGVRATSLMNLPSIIAGLTKTGTYKAIREKLTQTFHLRVGNIDTANDEPANYFEFPYDWRRDPRYAARKLEEAINHKLLLWRKHSGKQDAKVILLAHSMGGLVCRYYLEVRNGWQNCCLLITFGTPFSGSVKALDFLCNGHKIGRQDVTNLVRSFPSIYHLLPRYPVINVNNDYYRVAELPNLPNVCQKRTQDALEFHNEIQKAVGEHQNDINYLKDRYEILPVVGVGQQTFQSAVLSGEIFVCDKTTLPPGINESLDDGDETVPRVSAVPNEFRNEFIMHIGERHACLQENEVVLSYLCESLRSRQDNSICGKKEPVIHRNNFSLSIELNDYYRRQEPVVIKAIEIKGQESILGLTAQIEAVDPKKIVLLAEPFQAKRDYWRLETPNLEPGIYRITIVPNVPKTNKQNSLTPIHDYFEVGLDE